MLNLINIENISSEEILLTNYDLGIFASGYETRSTFFSKQINPKQIEHSLILGFVEHSTDPIRKENDKFYLANYGSIETISSQEEKELYGFLIDLFEKLKSKEHIIILIDYTSMARIWYSGILNFIRLQEKKKITVYLNYSFGEYNSQDFLDYSYSAISSIPFHEGLLSSNTKTLLVLAVGFSPYLIKSVIEEIEPNHTIAILPTPIDNEYEKISQSMKLDILVKDVDEWINSPINDLESVFCLYADITNNSFSTKDMLFLSLGPKLFTMASLLVAQRFPQVTCLYLKSSKIRKSDIKATGIQACNKITYSV